MEKKEKVTVATLAEKKEQGEKISMLTAYDYPTARLLEQGGVDMLLVGDSLGMVVLGYEDTLSVTMDDMVHHTRAVARGASRPLVVADMPFMSYQTGRTEALKNAGRLVKEGRAQAVKLEGGLPILDAVTAIVEAGIPVMGHLGLTPQAVNALGGYKVQGRSRKEVEILLKGARKLVEAGIFALVLECVPREVAALISEELPVPTIGIGAGPETDGQVLVTQDMLGFSSGFCPSFVRRYAAVGEEIVDACSRYIEELERGSFPDQDESFSLGEDAGWLEELRG